MAIPERFLDELLARTDIVDLVGEYVPLTQKGRNYWGLCPFHSERTPSFSVSADKQIYKCFGCGKGGGAINFVMEEENLSFPEAVRLLAKRAGMTMPESEGEGRGLRERREKLLELNRQAARIFHRQLYEPEGRAGLDYLRQRGLSKSTLTRFGLGFAPDRWDGMLRALGELGYDKRDLLEAGLAVNNQDGRIYDRFRGRVMFPIIDVRGNVIGFGGRVMDGSTPKYLNSPETLVYHKSRNLFALNIAKKSKAGRVILTEGYMDTIALHQAGFDSAVASLGTSLTAEHAQLLSRYFKHAIISYDGDGAGISAAQRAIPLLEKAGLKVKVLRVKGAKDPDEFIKAYGPQAFAKLLDQSENQLDYRLEQIRDKFDLEDDAQRVAFLQEAAAMLSTLPSPVEREIYGGKAAQMARITPQAMGQEVQKAYQRRVRREDKQLERRELDAAGRLQPKERSLRYANVRSAGAEEGVVRLAILDPGSLAYAGDLTPQEFTSPLLGKVYGLVCRRAREGLSTQLPALAGELQEEEMNHLAAVLERPQALEHSRQAMEDYITIIRQEAVKRGGNADDALLMAARSNYKEKKAYGGTP